MRIGVPAAIVLVTVTLTTHGKYSHSGDEPHYLIVAQSLLADGDLDLENNYRNGEARLFGPEDLATGPHARRTQTGTLWSTHDVGLPVLLLPVYGIATSLAARLPGPLLSQLRQTRGLFAYSIVSHALILFTAWGASMLLAGLSRVLPARRAAALVLVVTLSPPVLAHAFLVFPETVAFVVTCSVVWLLSLRTEELTAGRIIPVVAAVGGLPWLHRKYSFLVFGLAIVLAHRHWAWVRQRPRPLLVALSTLIVAPQLALHLWTLEAWGTIGGPQMLEGLPFGLDNLQRGALGMLLDRERGLVGYAPIYLVAPAAFVLSRRRTRWLLLPVALLFVPLAAFAVWDAGFSPAARFLVPLAPLVAVAAGEALDYVPFRRAAICLVAWQAVIVAVVWSSPRTLWPRNLGTNQALERIPVVGPLYEQLLPSLHTGGSVVGGWLTLAVVALFTVWLVRLCRTRASGRAGPHRQDE